MKQYKTYSFDIFDTCLIRKCGNPKLVHDIVASRILGPGATPEAIRDFANIRCRAERKAYAKLAGTGREEIDMAEIYDEADFSEYTSVSVETIMRTELEVEREQLQTVYDMKETVNNCRRISGGYFLSVICIYLLNFCKTFLKKKAFLRKEIRYLSVLR